MAEPHFFMLLPSNASLDLYSDNTLTSYTVHLPETIRLEGEYEVGLQSIIWPRSFYNVPDNISRIDYLNKDGIPDSVRIQPGYYDSMETLISAINAKMKARLTDKITLTFDKISEKVYVSVKNGYRLVLENQLSQILGFGGVDVIISESKSSPYVCDLNAGVECLYVYADILDYQFVGDTKARLLKVIPVVGKYGDIIYNSFDVPTYYPVGTKEFQDVTINIRSSANKKIQFSKGRVVVNLHFRKRQLSYFV